MKTAEQTTVSRIVNIAQHIGGVAGRSGTEDHGVKLVDAWHCHKLRGRKFQTFEIEAEEEPVELVKAAEEGRVRDDAKPELANKGCTHKADEGR